MCKNSPMFLMAAWLIVVLFLCMACMDEEAHQLVCILAATAVGCVYIWCESRVQRANAPLILREESVAEKTKPPEGRNE